uniref:Probable prefoldin subunit 5 n=1 Tax=Elaeis guineensis var. tenera TaxID=51953 RepID=A0A6I9SFE7_ELAGV|nr:probable prefoldin subunit 5 [Elaeis guineensis]
MDVMVGGQDSSHEGAVIRLRWVIQGEGECPSLAEAMDLVIAGMEVDLQAKRNKAFPQVHVPSTSGNSRSGFLLKTFFLKKRKPLGRVLLSLLPLPHRVGNHGNARAGGTIRVSDMEKMSVEQLKSLKEQSDLEVNLLQDSLNKIRTAATRLEIASSALHDLSLRPQGKKLLVPLTASLYVPGTLDDAVKVLVDVGTGYFIEKTMTESKDYCDRKINLLKSNYEELIEMASKKKNVADEAGIILQAKLRQSSSSA